MESVDGKLICLVRAKPTRPPGAFGRDVRQRRPGLLAHYQSWQPTISRSLPATRARPTSAWTRRLAAAGRHRRSDRRPCGPGQPRVALRRAFRTQWLGTAELIRMALTTRASSRTPTCPRSPWATVAPRQVRRGRRRPGDQPDAADRRQLRQRLRQQQVGRRGAAAGSQRPVRPAGRGVPLRHDPGRHQLRGPAQPARHVHPADPQPGGDRHRPGSFYEPPGDGNRQRRTTTVCQSTSSPRRSPRWARMARQRGSSPST